MGFNQAWLSAGVAVTLAPLSPVYDEPTAHLVVAVVEVLTAPERPTVAATLRRAIDSVRANLAWQHPVYWAAFLSSDEGALRLP